MSRYIDADAFVADSKWCGLETAEQVLFALAHQPSIDIVRCKECKYGSDNKVYGCSLINFNTDEWHRMYADDFCSRGERKESE